MRIRELHMINFKSYDDATISFDDGITVITGENGAGKSTILEGIQYALFKKNIRNSIRHGQDKSIVELTFAEKGKTYKVIRSKQGSKSSSSIQQLFEKGYETIVSGNKDTDIVIQSIIGMDSDMFSNAVYIKQGEITDLITRMPSERKKLLSKLLKIDDFEDCWVKLPQIISNYENSISELRGMASMEDSIVSELRSNESELGVLGNKLKSVSDKISLLKVEKADVVREKSLLSELKSEYAVLKNDLANGEKELARLRSEYSSLSREYEKIINDDKEMYMLEEEMDTVDIDVLNNQINDLNSEMKVCNINNKSLKKSLNELNNTTGKCPVCQSPITDEQKQDLIRKYNDTILENNKTISENTAQVNEIKKQKANAEKKQYRLLELKSSMKDRETTYNSMKKMQISIQEQEKQVFTMKSNLEMMGYDEARHNQLSEKEKEIDNLIYNAMQDEGMIKGKSDKITATIKSLKKDIEKIRTNKKDMRTLKQYVKLLNDIRAAYGKNGVQYEIRASAKPLIEKNTKRFFENFNFDYSDLSLTDDYEIIVKSADGETSMTMMSGGEQITVALALRLGITETIAGGNIECIILDEPTVHLDNSRINELSNILRTLNIVPQSIIVTHEETLENVADSLMKVEKVNGISNAING